jgi:hypothetical protein
MPQGELELFVIHGPASKALEPVWQFVAVATKAAELPPPRNLVQPPKSDSNPPLVRFCDHPGLIAANARKAARSPIPHDRQRPQLANIGNGSNGVILAVEPILDHSA